MRLDEISMTEIKKWAKEVPLPRLSTLWKWMITIMICVFIVAIFLGYHFTRTSQTMSFYSALVKESASVEKLTEKIALQNESIIGAKQLADAEEERLMDMIWLAFETSPDYEIVRKKVARIDGKAQLSSEGVVYYHSTSFKEEDGSFSRKFFLYWFIFKGEEKNYLFLNRHIDDLEVGDCRVLHKDGWTRVTESHGMGDISGVQVLDGIIQEGRGFSSWKEHK